jgi:mannose-6-phosphate isomerase-like protein (cupin superfamily)
MRAQGRARQFGERRGERQEAALIIPAGHRRDPEPQSHEGYEWLYVLDGRLRVILGERDLVLAEGEAAELDTRVPHWFGPGDGKTVELLSLFGRQGERAHLRARARPQRAG